MNIPFLSIYKSDAVAPGQAIVNHTDGWVVLNPRDAHKLREQLMVNNKEEAVFGPSPDNRRTRGPGHATKSRKTPPLAARVVAGVIVGGLIVWGVVSCGAGLAQGARYSECIQDARTAGQPIDEFTETECMKESR